jgi:Ion channel
MRKAFMAPRQPTITVFARRPRAKFSYLFFSQVLLLALAPYLEKPGLPVFLLRLLTAAALLTAVYAVSERRAQWLTALILGVPASILNAVSAYRPDSQIAVPTLITTTLFLAYALITLLFAVLRAETVTLDTIYGALSVYLLIAFVWGAAYLLLETLHPGALAMSSSRDPSHHIDWSDCMFYSFVTLTSLGYGDIVPVTSNSRSLSILEAVSGIMYVAVLIARLVGLHAASKPAQKS